ncbi:ferritin-like domain-containing protein [Kutzneria sp. 744]|uniref:ferritin-like domain-containing protein n=1 Tax=Kutzneria sp. (strain 744) TaxID=345341 RepID=UPI0003EEB19C|nr:ferritin-like domain-containing protein [Kutzneria sp. 744]EWM13699.1 violacein biosynthesis protein VioB [Kutzneria sp. 744]
MSVFDTPRLHFSGTAKTGLPTGTRNGLIDMATNEALTEYGPFPVHRPAREYHDYLHRLGPRFDASGHIRDDGVFSAAKGWNFGGNGHFSIDARIASCEVAPADVDVTDPVVGRSVDMWGHYNPYLATTVNRARIFDVDPSSNWTTSLMVGQFCFGRAGRSHEVGYMLTGEVRGIHPPRWHNFDHVLDVGGHCLASQLKQSTLYQFVVESGDGLRWLDEASVSPVVTVLRTIVASGAADGLVVQFALSDMSAPQEPDSPGHWALRGTIAPWRKSEPRTYPAGRLLIPRRAGLGNMTVDVTPDHVTLNMINSVPATGRADDSGAGPTHRLGPLLDMGDWELRTVSGHQLLARVPAAAYLADAALTSGVLTVPAQAPSSADEHALCVVGTDPSGARAVLLLERETNVQADDASLILDHPGDGGGDVEVQILSVVRGRPHAVEAIHVRQFFNPRALPRDPFATSPEALPGDIEIMRLRPGRADEPGDFSGSCVVSTDDEGRGWLTVRGARAGAARVLLSAHAEESPCDATRPGSAKACYDNDDLLGYWAGAGSLAVRVLPDDRRLDDIAQEDVTYDLVYREVFAFYELTSSFMSSEVFSLADRFMARTYADLIWQMCDPRTRMKTYHMPPTRDISAPKARLLLRFLRACRAVESVPTFVATAGPARKAITTRGELVHALRDAATLELAVMAQYLYAAFSIPTHAAGAEHVRRGQWSRGQLRLACGDGGQTGDGGMRGSLLTVAREEMIHFLAVNNIIMAIGEPFHVPLIDFGALNHQLPIPLDLSLEPLGVGSVARFIAIEQPARLVDEVGRRGSASPESDVDERYGSVSELYADIRKGLCRVPDLFLADKGRGGGEHHLFLRRAVNDVHPDYQLEVDDLASALFAVDVVTEQGEGNVLARIGPATGEKSHFETFLRMYECLTAEQLAGPPGRSAPWTPAYPALRNPTLLAGDAAKELVTDPAAAEVMRLFDRAYFMALQLMVQHFGESPDASLRRSGLMNRAIDVMTCIMRPLGELLTTMPSGRRGRTAGPSFELESVPGYVSRPDAARRGFSLRFRHLAAAARTCSAVPADVTETLGFLADFFGPHTMNDE